MKKMIYNNQDGKMNFLKNKTHANSFATLFLAVLLFSPIIANAAGLIPCGGNGENPCTICYIVVGFNGIINKALYLSFFIGLAVLAFAAVMYIVSAGDSGITGTAKSAMKNAVIGIVVMFSAWLMVNYTMQLLGTKPGLGIENIGGWDKFQCEGQVANTGDNVITAPNNASSPTPSTSSVQNEKGKLGESCGVMGQGTCMDTTMTFCPFGKSHIYFGKSCELGLGCCI